MTSRRNPPPSLPRIATDAILESISDGVFTVDGEWRISSFNRAAEQITGVTRDDAIGRRCSDVFRASMCEGECALRHTMDTGAVIVNKTTFIINSAGKRIPISVSTAILRDEHGKVVGGAETFRDLSLIEELRTQVRGRFQVGDIVSRSPSMRRLIETLPRVAESESTILVQGETGTGKELVARAIHGLSPRHNGPFVAVNCGALPDSLLESELFGYKAGAFTGATKDKPGRFALARGGTLFLDEIGEISQALQVRLLRAHYKVSLALERFGVEITWLNADESGRIEAHVKPNTRMIFCESPTNPLCKIIDIAALAAVARKHTIKLVVDNTFATPYHQNPLLLGADLVVHSATKALGGHNDLMAGAIAGGKDDYDNLWFSRQAFGTTLDAYSASLLERGLKTFEIRAEKMAANAYVLAAHLSRHPAAG